MKLDFSPSAHRCECTSTEDQGSHFGRVEDDFRISVRITAIFPRFKFNVFPFFGAIPRRTNELCAAKDTKSEILINCIMRR